MLNECIDQLSIAKINPSSLLFYAISNRDEKIQFVRKLSDIVVSLSSLESKQFFLTVFEFDGLSVNLIRGLISQGLMGHVLYILKLKEYPITDEFDLKTHDLNFCHWCCEYGAWAVLRYIFSYSSSHFKESIHGPYMLTNSKSGEGVSLVKRIILSPYTSTFNKIKTLLEIFKTGNYIFKLSSQSDHPFEALMSTKDEQLIAFVMQNGNFSGLKFRPLTYQVNIDKIQENIQDTKLKLMKILNLILLEDTLVVHPISMLEIQFDHDYEPRPSNLYGEYTEEKEKLCISLINDPVLMGYHFEELLGYPREISQRYRHINLLYLAAMCKKPNIVKAMLQKGGDANTLCHQPLICHLLQYAYFNWDNCLSIYYIVSLGHGIDKTSLRVYLANYYSNAIVDEIMLNLNTLSRINDIEVVKIQLLSMFFFNENLYKNICKFRYNIYEYENKSELKKLSEIAKNFLVNDHYCKGMNLLLDNPFAFECLAFNKCFYLVESGLFNCALSNQLLEDPCYIRGFHGVFSRSKLLNFINKFGFVPTDASVPPLRVNQYDIEIQECSAAFKGFLKLVTIAKEYSDELEQSSNSDVNRLRSI